MLGSVVGIKYTLSRGKRVGRMVTCGEGCILSVSHKCSSLLSFLDPSFGVLETPVFDRLARRPSSGTRSGWWSARSRSRIR